MAEWPTVPICASTRSKLATATFLGTAENVAERCDSTQGQSESSGSVIPGDPLNQKSPWSSKKCP